MLRDSLLATDVARMPPVTLGEMSSIQLMNRMDTKFVTSVRKLRLVLSDAAAAGYRVCEIGGERLLGYHSVYYDTEDRAMYLAHHNRRLVRQKIRVRTYLVNGLTYLEIKDKNNKGRTRKERISVPEDFSLDVFSEASAAEFAEIRTNWPLSSLTPEVSTDFSRITLVDPAMTERVTMDASLSFRNFRNGGAASLGDAVVVELKQDSTADSAMKRILLNHRVFPFGMSKYCIGTAMTEKDIKRNRFKLKLRQIEKITKQNSL